MQIPELKEIILIGFYQSSESLSKFIQNAQHKFNIPIRYITNNYYFESTVITLCWCGGLIVSALTPMGTGELNAGGNPAMD